MGKKGGNNERLLAKQLSLWWTQDLPTPRDDVFWRTGGSGGRATVRGKRLQRTHNQYGDICAADPIGEPLLDLVTIEAKKGYSIRRVKGVKKRVSGATIADLLDKPERAASQPFEEFLQQAIAAHLQAGSYAWLLIQHRDHRQAVVFMPGYLWNDILDGGLNGDMPEPFLSLNVDGRLVSGLLLKDFLCLVTPRAIKRLLERV